MFGKKKRIDNLYIEAKEYAEDKLAIVEARNQEPKFSIDFSDAQSKSDIQFSEEPYWEKSEERSQQKDSSSHREVRYSLRRSVFDELLLSDEVIGSISDKINATVKSTFVDCLLLYIDANHLKDSYVYKSAGIDRRLYSKMVSDRNYKPSKDTCIALCFALKLHEYDFKELLSKAGYTLSDSIKRDQVIEYFLKNRIYDVACINGVLEKMGFKPLNK